MHQFHNRPRRIAGCLDGADLAAAQAEWDAIDKTPERQEMRRQRKLAQQRHAPSRENDSTRRVDARHESVSQRQQHTQAEQIRRDNHARALIRGNEEVHTHALR